MKTDSDSVQFTDFFGERFAVPARVNQRLVVRFGRLAAEGADTEDMDEAKANEAAILLDRMIEQMVRPEDKDRFEATCDRERPSDEELMEFIAKVLGALSRRPTSRSSDSSDGPTSTQPSSEDGSSSRAVIERLENRGRPDLALMVTMADEGRSRATA